MKTRGYLSLLAICYLLLNVPVSALPGEMRMPLVAEDGGIKAAIIAGEEIHEYATRLGTVLKKRLGVEFPVLTPGQVLEENNWRFREEYRDSSFLLLGNVHNNRAVFALFSRYLAGANASYPGESRYIIRTVFQPFDRDAHMLLVGASDDAGLSAGIARLDAMLSANRGLFEPVIETGDAAGPAPIPADELQLARLGPARKPFINDATLHYWQGCAQAGKRAVNALLEDITGRERGLFWPLDMNAHYDWEGHFRALFQLLASGIMTSDQRRLVEERVLDYAFHNADSHALWIMNNNPEVLSANLSRHMITAFTGMYLLHEYLYRIAYVPMEEIENVATRYGHLYSHMSGLLDSETFDVSMVGAEGGDAINNLAALYMHLGDGRAVSKNLFRNMSEIYLNSMDNMGYHVGDDAYITAGAGSHLSETRGGLGLLLAAYFHHDGMYRWILENRSHYFNTILVRDHPAIEALAASAPLTEKPDGTGVFLSPVNHAWKELIEAGGNDITGLTDGSIPLTRPTEALYSKAVLRDGFMPDDAFLALEGINYGGILGGRGSREGYSCNAILRYTEYGTILLFTNTRRQSWARSVVSPSRGTNEPQSAAAFSGGSFNSNRASGITGVMEENDGVQWHRSVIRRHNGYFIVLDRMTAHHDDTYNFTCRWRSFHQGEMVSDRRFQAIAADEQVRLNIESSSPVTWEVNYEPRDGATRPTMVKQLRQERLKSGESAVFHNLLYAVDEYSRRSLGIKSFSDNAILIKGDIEWSSELAMAGYGQITLPGLNADANLWFLSGSVIALAGPGSLEIEGLVNILMPDATSIVIDPSDCFGHIENKSSQPVPLNINLISGKVSIAGRSVSGKIMLPPGRHEIIIDGLPKKIEDVLAGIEKAWESITCPEAQQAPALPYQRTVTLERLWSAEAGNPGYMRHGNVRFSAEPETDVGDISLWSNRNIRYGQPVAGWKDEGGTIVMDMGEPIDVSRIKLIRGRHTRSMEDAFYPGEFFFDIELSNDNFHRDIRKKEIRHDTYRVHIQDFTVYNRPMFYPSFEVPVYDTARYIKLTPIRQIEVRDRTVGFAEIEVYRNEYEPRLPAKLVTGNFGSGMVLHEASGRLQMFDANGSRTWEHDLGYPLACGMYIADFDGDGQDDIIAYTLSLNLFITGADGTVKMDYDLFQEAMKRPPDTRRWWVRGRRTVGFHPNAIAAWRPDSTGRKEILLFPHASFFVRIKPDGTVSFPTGTPHSGRYVIPVPDMDGDGLDELAVIGMRGNNFGILSSASVERNSVRALYTKGLTGHFSWMNLLPLYYEGTGIHCKEDKWLGIVSVNPGGLDFLSTPDFKRRWAYFHHPPNLSKVVHDITGSGVPEILTGREDGYVVAYCVNTGKMAARKALDGPVRALAAAGGYIAAGTGRGLVLMDKSLDITAYRPGSVESLAFIECDEGRLILISADSTGSISAYRPVPFKK